MKRRSYGVDKKIDKEVEKCYEEADKEVIGSWYDVNKKVNKEVMRI